MRILSWLRRRRASELLYDRGASGDFNHVHWTTNRTGFPEHVVVAPSSGSGRAAVDNPAGEDF